MKSKAKLLWTAVILAVLLGGGVLAYTLLGDGVQPEEAVPPQSDRMQAPDFTVIDQTGKEIRLSDIKGKPTIVNFWATWCGPCKSEMPAFDTMYQKYGDQVQFMMVNLTDGAQETVAAVKEFILQQGYKFPVYFDTAMDAANTYSVYSIPMTLYIDENGFLVGQHTGAMSEATLENSIQNLLGGK